MIAVIDYGAGNIGSVMNMFRKLGIPAARVSDKDQLRDARALLLPGVGAFDFCMQQFNTSGMRETVETLVLQDKKPVLGICVGFQMMFAGSEEGREKGLNWIDGEVIRFRVNDLKVPHMGWNTVQPHNTTLFDHMIDPRFYFVHSYHPQCASEADVRATAHYGYDFCCGAGHDNLQGVQFHPEKSHKYGMQLFRNFYAGLGGA